MLSKLYKTKETANMKSILITLLLNIPYLLDAKQIKNESTNMCPTTAYINSGHEVVMKKNSSDQSEAIAIIQNGQYLCLLDDSFILDKWVKIKTVPLLKGVCDSNISDKEFCKTVGNFPIKWLSKQSHSFNCKLNFDIDEGGNGFFTTTGNCPTGWIEKKYINYIGD